MWLHFSYELFECSHKLLATKWPSHSSFTALHWICFSIEITKSQSIIFSLFLFAFFAASFDVWQSLTCKQYFSITLQFPCWLRWQLEPLPHWLAVKHHFVPVNQVSSPHYVSLSWSLTKGQCFSIWIAWSLLSVPSMSPIHTQKKKQNNKCFLFLWRLWLRW